MKINAAAASSLLGALSLQRNTKVSCYLGEMKSAKCSCHTHRRLYYLSTANELQLCTYVHLCSYYIIYLYINVCKYVCMCALNLHLPYLLTYKSFATFVTTKRNFLVALCLVFIKIYFYRYVGEFSISAPDGDETKLY